MLSMVTRARSLDPYDVFRDPHRGVGDRDEMRGMSME
jgi:hypothetical protein